MGAHHVIESHASHHCGVPHGLEVHEASIIGAFEFNNHNLALGVQGQKVDPSAAFLPLAILFSDHKQT